MKSFYIQWHLLNRCNLRCIHCYQEDFTSKDEVSFDELKKIYNNLIKSMEILNSNLNVALTGGEPFLFKDLFKLIEMIEKEKFVKKWSIITNGIFLSKFSKELKNFKKLKDIKVSMDGFSDKSNDLIRGDGSFKKIMEGIEEAKAEKLKVILMFTAMKLNKKEIKNLIPFMKSNGLDGAIIERFIPLGNGFKIKENVLDFNDWKEICLEILKGMEIEVDLKELSPYKAFKIEWKGKDLDLAGSLCIVGKDGGALMPSGNFYPCRRLPISQGNLKGKNLKEIFDESEFFEKLKERKNLGGRCGICGIDFCIGCRAYVYSLKGNPFLEDPICFL